MYFRRYFAAPAALLLAVATAWSAAFAQTAEGAPARTIITVLPKSSEQVPPIQPDNLKVQVNGKNAPIDNVTPLQGNRAGLELVILIDSAARTSLGRQMDEISTFVKALPPTTQVAIAYMMNGQAVFEQPFTADKDQALRALHLPVGSPGSSASPYFCISDLAKRWPSRDPNNRREVLAITDGIDPYQVRFDPSDPYLQAATNDSVRAGVIVDALYWHDEGLASRRGFLASGGQSLLTLITDNTGGTFYYQGLSNPVSFAPFLNDLGRRLQNQYELSFQTAPAKKKVEVQSLKVKLEVPGVKLTSAKLVAVSPGQ